MIGEWPEDLQHYVIRWERPPRYYLVHVHRDLFGGWVVTRVWGSIGGPSGHTRRDPVDGLSQARALVERIAQSRARHAYRLILQRCHRADSPGE